MIEGSLLDQSNSNELSIEIDDEGNVWYCATESGSWSGPFDDYPQLWFELAPEGESFREISCSFRWKDQGWGGQKGILMLRLLRDGTIVLSQNLTDHCAFHEWTVETVKLSNCNVVDCYQSGDTFAVWRYVGGCGGHKLFVQDFRICFITNTRAKCLQPDPLSFVTATQIRSEETVDKDGSAFSAVCLAFGLNSDDVCQEKNKLGLSRVEKADNFIIALRLDGMGLTGSIPAALFNLVNLNILSISNNELIGSIPEAIGSLSGLVSLDLSNNQLTGVPISICGLTKLTNLSLAGNFVIDGDPLPMPEHLEKFFGTAEFGAWAQDNSIHAQCLKGHVENVESVDIMKLDKFGWHPLMYACFNDFYSLALQLATSAGQQLLDDNPSHHWPFGCSCPTADTIADWNVTLHGGASITPFSRPGSSAGSLYLNGKAQYAQINGVRTFGGPITLSMWVYIIGNERSWARIYDFGGIGPRPDVGHDNLLFSTNGHYHIYEGSMCCEAKAENQISQFTWVHVVTTVDDVGNLAIYYDGVLCTSSQGFAPPVASRANLYFGRSNWSSDPYFMGYLADYRMYYKALSAIQVKMLYKACFAESSKQFVVTAISVNTIGNICSSINEKNKDGRTSLSIAAESGCTKLVQLLIEAKADVNANDIFGWSPLDWASRYGHFKVVQALTTAGSNMKKANIFDQHMQLYMGKEIKYSASFCPSNNCFDLSRKNKWVDVSEDGLTASVVEMNNSSAYGVVYLKQPVHSKSIIVESNYVEFELLVLGKNSFSVSFGLADPTKLIVDTENRQGHHDSDSYYYSSFDGNYFPKSKSICAPGPKISVGDTVGIGFDRDTKTIFFTLNGEKLGTPFTNVEETLLVPVIGFYGQHEYCVRVKLARSLCDGINLSPHHNGFTALHLAAERGFSKTVKQLLIAGADPTTKDNWKYTPLNWAVDRNEDIVRQLLDTKTPFEDDTLAAVIPLLAESIKCCNYQKIASYVKSGVKWKDTVKTLTDAEVKKFALDCKILDLDIMSAQGFAIWVTITSQPETENTVKEYVKTFPCLVAARDEQNRPAINFADPSIADIIKSMTLLFGRYKLLEDRPEHMSATCFVFKATDEMARDPITGEKTFIRVALKLMIVLSQFIREIDIRKHDFNSRYIINILEIHLPTGVASIETGPMKVELSSDVYTRGVLSKSEIESMYCLVMPLADRNLFVAMKQERFAGRDVTASIYIFRSLVACAAHLHSKGIVHADIKTLNAVRMDGEFKLIDLDAASEIGNGTVGHKSSSAYCPPEVIHFSEDRKCFEVKPASGFDSLVAHPSFDVWSLGCILYQLLHPQVMQLFQGGRDDNLTNDTTVEDNLSALYEWSDKLKSKKLSVIANNDSSNLLSRMLMKDPIKRITLQQVLAHPFISGKKPARMAGEVAKYDAMISYRFASDRGHTQVLYEALISRGYTVFWDTKCLKSGEDWEQGFIEGILSSRAFIPILSRNAINHPSITSQNFSNLEVGSRCDNVLLEYYLAVELHGFGLIERIFPIFVGDYDVSTGHNHYFQSGCHPQLPEINILSIEEKLVHHLDSQALGVPLVPKRTVKAVVDAITNCQGSFIVGEKRKAFDETVDKIAVMIEDMKGNSINASSGVSAKIQGGDSEQVEELIKKLALKDSVIEANFAEVAHLRNQLNTPLRYRADFPGKKVPIRAEPSHDATCLGFVRHRNLVEFSQGVGIQGGFYKLRGQPGWVYAGFAGINWVAEPVAARPTEHNNGDQL